MIKPTSSVWISIFNSVEDFLEKKKRKREEKHKMDFSIHKTVIYKNTHNFF